MPLPSLGELSQAEFMSPMMFQQAQNQIGLGNQQAQQNLDQGAANLQATTLQNLFNEQNNPQLVEQQGLMNVGRGYTNRENAVKAKQTEELAATDTEAKRAEMLKKVDEDKLASLTARGQALMMDPDPEKAAAGKKMMDASFKEQQRRAKEAAEQTKAETLVGGRLGVANINAAQRGTANTLDNQTRLAIAQMKSADNQAKMANNVGKPAKNLEEELARSYKELSTESDPEKRQDLLEYVNGVNQLLVGVKQAASGQQIDAAAVANLPKRPQSQATMPPVIAAPPRPAAPGANMMIPVPGQQVPGPTNTTEAGMARDLAPLLAKVNTPQEAQKEIQDTQAMMSSMPPQDRQNAQQYIDGLKAKFGGGTKPPAPQSKPGYVVLYKDGKPVGQVPAAKAEAAKAQGYTIQ